MPRYGINTDKRQAAFLATVAYESQYFQKTKEGLARKGTRVRKLQDAYWSSGFYGRGLIQVTHEAGYRAFDTYCHSILNTLLDFLANPSLLEQPQWAVESACWYWIKGTRLNLNLNADKGDFFCIQGLVNRCDINKEALEYDTREKLYNRALALLRINKTPSISPAPSSPPPTVNPPSPENSSVSANADASANVAVSSADSPNLLGRFSDLVTWLQGVASRSSDVEASVSRSSWATYIFKQLLAGALLIASFLFHNPIYLIAAVAIIGFATYYLTASKQRASSERIAQLYADK